jgi:hypothetical protein
MAYPNLSSDEKYLAFKQDLIEEVAVVLETIESYTGRKQLHFSSYSKILYTLELFTQVRSSKTAEDGSGGTDRSNLNLYATELIIPDNTPITLQYTFIHEKNQDETAFHKSLELNKVYLVLRYPVLGNFTTSKTSEFGINQDEIVRSFDETHKKAILRSPKKPQTKKEPYTLPFQPTGLR